MEYKTVGGYGEDVFIERKSRFIGYVKPVTTEQEALDFIAEIKTKHWDATHNVSAYVLRSGTKRYSDDGEPQGTAGVPVLEVIEKQGLCDVCVVVTRYFGGILLGAGGLVRAYSHGAKIGIDAAGVLVMTRCKSIRLEFDYALYGKIQYILPDYTHKVLNTDFGEVVTLELAVKEEETARLAKQLSEMSAGMLIPDELGTEFFAF